MKVFAAICIGILALFLVFFVITGVRDSLRDFGSLRDRLADDEDEVATGDVVAAPAGSGVVRGETFEAPNLVYPGADLQSVVRDYPFGTTFRTLFTDANGASFLEAPTMYTLFIPTDTAFANLSRRDREVLATMTDAERLRLVQYHIVPKSMVAVGLQKAGSVYTLSGDELNFNFLQGRKSVPTVGNARIVAVYYVENGVAYVIDRVLLPPEE